MAVERGQAHSDDLLRGNTVSILSAPDRHLTTALVLGVLRWQIQLDQQLRSFLSKPNAKLDPEVVIALRLGAFQLLHLDRIPARAAIDESVELTKQAGHRFAAGLVNAVLRKLAERPVDQGLTSPNKNLVGQGISPDLSPAVAGHPNWMVARWARFFGADAAGVICHHNQSQPTLAIRLATPEAEAELLEAGISLEPGALLTAARIVTAGEVMATTAFREGLVHIQDEGSQAVAEVAGKGRTILDCCAAPGGKTLILAERNPEARIVACEASASRLEQLWGRMAGLGKRIECRLADATALSFEYEFDVVLADVPCSGTGTLGRNPEIRHRLRPEDLPRQAERQRAILSSALRAVRPGGRVVYSTCSLEPEENELVIAAVVSETSGVRISPMAQRIEEMLAQGILTEKGAERLQSCITLEGYLRLLPGAFGTDGFFIAMIEKVP
jgi:16S rRNA (cytosine967-C5)-methyltransferase